MSISVLRDQNLIVKIVTISPHLERARDAIQRLLIAPPVPWNLSLIVGVALAGPSHVVALGLLRPRSFGVFKAAYDKKSLMPEKI